LWRLNEPDSDFEFSAPDELAFSTKIAEVRDHQGESLWRVQQQANVKASPARGDIFYDAAPRWHITTKCHAPFQTQLRPGISPPVAFALV
jgi:hypothetical protein